jgi:hypothetical protein
MCEEWHPLQRLQTLRVKKRIIGTTINESHDCYQAKLKSFEAIKLTLD